MLSRKALFEICPADAEDAEAILICLKVAFVQYRSEYTPEAFADTILDSDTVQRRLGEMRLFVAVSGGRIVGTIGCQVNGEEGHLRGMAVVPEWQGSGVAAALLQTAEAELRKSRCKRVTLDTTKPLKRAVQFYQRHGFSASGQVSDFFGMQLYEYTKALPDAS